ncbi:ABC transporter permease subunit [Actinomadura alba]|uniref:ABC transporter permease subunit n=1 Tax=Actinomadura alba TaxID=406431 RepID=UPI001C9BFBF9|nr:ABC transporter permease subunit [Actinomadura alba]
MNRTSLAASLAAVSHAEWIKMRTVRSTVWALLLTPLVSVGLGWLVARGLRSGFENGTAEWRGSFDPVHWGFYSLTLGQLAIVVFGVLLVGGEYGSGTIRASLAVVPRRGALYWAKVLAGTSAAFACALVTAFVTFFVAQAAFGPYGVSLGAGGALRATVGACLYLTLMCAFAIGVAAMLRSSAAALGILMPLLFLGSQGLGNVPKVKVVLQYLPDQAGFVITQVIPPDDPRFARDYGPWGGLAVLVAWVVVALIGGYLVLRRRDA